MTPWATLTAAVLLAAPLAAGAQTLAETTVATTTAEELGMAKQAREVTRSAIDTVFGAGQSPPPAAGADAAGVATPPDVGAPNGENAWDAATAPDADPLAGDASEGAAAGTAEVDPRRDPFRPFTLRLRADVEVVEEILSPLQRYELPQLRLAAVVLESRPPRAMLQDNSGMGFIVTPGTPIGRRHGVVKSIEARRIVVEERVIDHYGRPRPRDIIIEMPTDEKREAQEKR